MKNLKLLTKNCRNKPKSAKKWQNLGYRGKKSQILNFPGGARVLIHTRRHLGESFRKFSAKTNVEIRSYKSKKVKYWIFGQNGHFLTVFDHKRKNDFFSEICFEHFLHSQSPN